MEDEHLLRRQSASHCQPRTHHMHTTRVSYRYYGCKADDIRPRNATERSILLSAARAPTLRRARMCLRNRPFRVLDACTGLSLLNTKLGQFAGSPRLRMTHSGSGSAQAWIDTSESPDQGSRAVQDLLRDMELTPAESAMQGLQHVQETMQCALSLCV